MKKEKQEIGVNLSSGAEKVERVTKQTKTTAVKSTPNPKETAKGEAALGSEQSATAKQTQRVSAKKVNTQSAGSKAEKESAAAKARVERALKKQEEKAKKKAEKVARAQKRKEERAKRLAEYKKKLAEDKAAIKKRKAQKKANAEKHAAERKALAEKRAAEKEEKLRNRAHAKANRNKTRAQKRAESKKKREERRQNRNARREERKQGAQGYGGWLAAVVSLGVVTLALATTVTVGAVEMRREQGAVVGDSRRTMYELTGIMENVDSDLDRVRISNSPAQQSRILTDLLVQARLAELDLEKMPITAETDSNITSFINRTAHECERLLSKLRRGETLSAADYEILDGLYQTNHKIRASLDELCAKTTDKDWLACMRKNKGNFFDAMGKIDQTTMEENRAFQDKMKEQMPGAGMRLMPKPDEKEGDFSRIDPAQAEELCKQYFPKINITEYRCIGETVGRGFRAYNVQGYDDKGTQLFAEIAQKDGALLRFDYYEDCVGDTFDFQNAERIAEEFLQSLGYQDMEVVRLRENDTNVDFTFVYANDGVVYYPDTIHVKVCRNRGIVMGMDATKYIARHRDRAEAAPTLSLAAAYDKLHEKLEVISSRVAVVDTMRGEKLAYEFLCAYGEENYFVFLDANSGDEISIINTKHAQ